MHSKIKAWRVGVCSQTHVSAERLSGLVVVLQSLVGVMAFLVHLRNGFVHLLQAAAMSKAKAQERET